MAQSIMDYIFRRLALDYLAFETRAGLGIYTAEERPRHLETGSYEPLADVGDAAEVDRRPLRPGRRRAGRAVRSAELVETDGRARCADDLARSRHRARSTPRPSSWRRSPAPPPTPRSA